MISSQRPKDLGLGTFTAFTKDNDPHGERDGARVMVNGLSIFFKIDYYDHSLTRHSPNPADPAVTSRVMTVMIAHEY